MGNVILISPEGNAEEFTAEEAPKYLDPRIGYRLEGATEHAQRIGQQAREGQISGAESFGQGVGRGLTAGGTDALQRLGGGQRAAQYLREAESAHPTLSTAGDITGAVLPAILTDGGSLLARTPAAAIGRLGAGITELGEGAGALGRIGAAAAGGAAEGALFGAGGGVSELAMSDKPIDAERIVSTLSSHALYGAGIGGAAGTLGKVAEIGLGKAKGALDEAIAAREARAAGDEVAIAAERKSIADDVSALRREVKDNKHFLTTKDVELPVVEGQPTAAEIGAKAMKAEKQLRGLLDDPRGLAEKPQMALKGLRIQEDAYTAMLNRADDFKAAFAADKTGARMAALDTIPAALEKNRALQQRIADITTNAAKAGAPGLAEKAAGIPQRMLEGSVFGKVADVAKLIPIPGMGMVSHLLGAEAAKFVGEKVFGRLSKTVGESAARTSQAVSKFLDTGARVTKAATPVATKVLSSVRFAPEVEQPKRPSEPVPPDTLARHFADRTQEIRSQIMPGPDGKTMMRPEARQALGDRLQPIAAANPKLADMLETLIARRLTFLADKMPRMPDILGNQVGPSRWQPPDMEIRKFARYVAAVEDPGAIEERLASGTVSPEDVEVMREVYPERLREITQQIVAQLPQLRGQLPYERKLALSMMTGIPVSAAMDPQILGVLQGTFASETPEDGKPPGPVAKAQFGSVSAKSAPEPTPAQERAG